MIKIHLNKKGVTQKKVFRIVADAASTERTASMFEEVNLWNL